MTIKDIQFLMDAVLRRYKEIPTHVKLNGMSRALVHRELLAVAYYNATIDLLVKTGTLKLSNDNDIMFLIESSTPQEDDYE